MSAATVRMRPAPARRRRSPVWLPPSLPLAPRPAGWAWRPSGGLLWHRSHAGSSRGRRACFSRSSATTPQPSRTCATAPSWGGGPSSAVWRMYRSSVRAWGCCMALTRSGPERRADVATAHVLHHQVEPAAERHGFSIMSSRGRASRRLAPDDAARRHGPRPPGTVGHSAAASSSQRRRLNSATISVPSPLRVSMDRRPLSVGADPRPHSRRWTCGGRRWLGRRMRCLPRWFSGELSRQKLASPE